MNEKHQNGKIRALQTMSDHVLAMVQEDLDGLTGVTRLAKHLDRLRIDEAYREGAQVEREVVHTQWVEVVANAKGKRWRQKAIHDFSVYLAEGK